MRTDFIEVKVNIVQGDRPLSKMAFTMKKTKEKSTTAPTSIKISTVTRGPT
jgi:hypothetical protein